MDDHILDPNAQVARGVIETRLHGEERARRDAVAILGRAAQVRPLVDLEADPVPQAVDVALLKPLVLPDRLVSALLEEIADLLLVHARGGLGRQRVDRPLDGLAHERVELLELGRRAPNAERAGHVEVVASARLDRVEVDHDRSPLLDHIAVVPHVVGDARVPPHRDDVPVRLLEVGVEEDLPHLTSQPADGDPPFGILEPLSLETAAADDLADPLVGPSTSSRDRPDRVDLVRLLAEPSPVEEAEILVLGDLDPRRPFPEPVQDVVVPADLAVAVNQNGALHPQLPKHLDQKPGVGALPRSFVFENLPIAVRPIFAQLESSRGGAVPLHRGVHQVRPLARAPDENRRADVGGRGPGEVAERRVRGLAAQDDRGREPALFEKSVDVALHGSSGRAPIGPGFSSSGPEEDGFVRE